MDQPIKPNKTGAADPHLELIFLRNSIDNIDEAILHTLLHRAQLINSIIQYKKINHIPLLRSDLRQEIINDLIDFSSKLNLNATFVRKIIDFLFEESNTFYKSEIQNKINEFFTFNKNMISRFNSSLQHLDIAFLSLLSERMYLVECVGRYKKNNNIQPLAKERWKNVLKTKTEMAKSLHINTESIQKLYTLIHEEALAIEENIMQRS